MSIPAAEPPRALQHLGFALAFSALGALLFVTSLAYFLYFVLVVLGTPGPAPRALADVLRPVLFDLVLFSAFASHHSVMARAGAKRAIVRLLPAPLERAAYVWIASALFFAACFFWRDIPGVAYDAPGALHWLLYAVQAAGMGLVVSVMRSLDALELAGVRQVLDAAGASLEDGRDRQFRPQPLLVTGPFRLVRHPLYLGWVLFVFGPPVMTANRLAFALISSGYLVLAIPWEERSLRATYGAAYEAYAATVRWRLLPGIY